MRASRWIFLAGAGLALSAILTAGLLIAGDVYLHERYKNLVGLNVLGYRGPLAIERRAKEKRIVVLGGSTVFGYGVPYEQSFPALLERSLNAQHDALGDLTIRVINLGGNSEGAFAFKHTLRDYRSLQYDVVILYEGYTDLGPPNRYLFRHTSPVFRLTGYFPIFPTIFREKAAVLRQGHLEGASRKRKTGFELSMPRQIAASAIETTVNAYGALECQLTRWAPETLDQETISGAALCWKPWTFYCEQVYQAVRQTLDEGKSVMVVTQPYSGRGHKNQQRALSSMLYQQFKNDSRVRYVNLGRAVDMRDRTLCADGMHLTMEGNRRIAEGLVKPAIELLRRAARAATARPAPRPEHAPVVP